MTTPQIVLLVCSSLAFLAIGLLSFFTGNHTLNIKSKTVGDGRHGTARWATKQEIARTFAHVPFTPKLWCSSNSLPQQQSIVAECNLTAAVVQFPRHLRVYSDLARREVLAQRQKPPEFEMIMG